MYFVGRSRETRLVIDALRRGRNVIIAGRYGMGRTTLMRHIAHIAKDTFNIVFVDFTKTPAYMCRQLIDALFSHAEKDRSIYANRYKFIRSQILSDILKNRRPHVLVLDEVEKLTMHKKIFLQHLVRSERFIFVAVVASFLPEKEYRQLAEVLRTPFTLELGHLDKNSTQMFFKHAASQHGFLWTDDQIRRIALRTHGYPLSMREIIDAECARHARTGEDEDAAPHVRS